MIRCYLAIIAVVALLSFAVWMCARRRHGSRPQALQHSAGATLVLSSASPCPSYTSLSATVPADMSPPNSQANANCFAWQEFIALNWTGLPSTCAADASVTAAKFGNPQDTTPKVWELYKQDTDVFLPGAAAPTGWCSQSEVVPAKFRAESDADLLSSRGASKAEPKFLLATSKDADDPQVKLSEYEQAGTNGAWLTAQSGIMALYEIRINQDEFSYIDQSGLYNAQIQQTFVMQPGINLPDGTSGNGTTGSIEIKASWLELDDSTQWPLYKTSSAWVIYPGSSTPKQVTVGLTGLHIIHKTGRSPQFIWATFEHINNAPSRSDVSNNTFLPWYAFYSKACNPQTDHYQCTQNAQIGGATPSSPYFPHTPADPMSAPIQVVRQNPISTSSTDNIQAINAWAQQLIASANPNSVFKNYQLVDVLWAQNPATIPAQATVPLTSGNPQPNPTVELVANTTLETYLQNTDTCLSCHVFAPIADPTQARKHVVHALLSRPSLSGNAGGARLPVAHLSAPGTYASDYSFLFGEAESPSAAAARTVRRLTTGTKIP